MAEKDNMKVNTSPVADVETGTAEDVEAIMKKYDRESNTRIWEGTPKQVIRFLLAAFSVLMLYMNLFANWDERVRRSLFVGFVIILSFLVYPMKKGSSKRIPFRSTILSLWYSELVLTSISYLTLKQLSATRHESARQRLSLV